MSIQEDMTEHLDGIYDKFTAMYWRIAPIHDEIDVIYGRVMNGKRPSQCLLLKKDKRVGLFLLEPDNFERALENKEPLKIVHRRAEIVDENVSFIPILEKLLSVDKPVITSQEGCMAVDTINDLAFWMADENPS
jgi:hypothetical protein